MKSLMKKFVAVTASALATVLIAGSAFASQYGTGDLTNLSTYLSSNGASVTQVSNFTLSGNYYFTPLAYEADYTNLFRTSSSVLFTNTSLSTEFGTVKQANAALAYFSDTTGWKNYSLYDTSHVDVYQLTKDWTVNGVTLTAGTLLIGLNDSAGTCGGDFDDFILAASKVAPTPVPAAVWLLGSGLLGVMGFKRTRKGETA